MQRLDMELTGDSLALMILNLDNSHWCHTVNFGSKNSGSRASIGAQLIMGSAAIKAFQDAFKR